MMFIHQDESPSRFQHALEPSTGGIHCHRRWRLHGAQLFRGQEVHGDVLGKMYKVAKNPFNPRISHFLTM
jgi:hypothetical protein